MNNKLVMIKNIKCHSKLKKCRFKVVESSIPLPVVFKSFNKSLMNLLVVIFSNNMHVMNFHIISIDQFKSLVLNMYFFIFIFHFPHWALP